MKHEKHPTSSTYNMGKYYCEYQPETKHPSYIPLMKCYITLTGVCQQYSPVQDRISSPWIGDDKRSGRFLYLGWFLPMPRVNILYL